MWEWSFTQEGMENIRENVHRMDKERLIVAYAEILHFRHVNKKNDSAKLDVSTWYKTVYAKKLTEARKQAKWSTEAIAEEVYYFAEEQADCTNGGFSAYVCPYGCHTVSLEIEQEAEGAEG